MVLLSDKEVVKFLGNGQVKTEQEVHEFLTKNIAHYQQHGFCLFDIFEKESGQFIGDAGLIY